MDILVQLNFFIVYLPLAFFIYFFLFKKQHIFFTFFCFNGLNLIIQYYSRYATNKSSRPFFFEKIYSTCCGHAVSTMLVFVAHRSVRYTYLPQFGVFVYVWMCDLYLINSTIFLYNILYYIYLYIYLILLCFVIVIIIINTNIWYISNNAPAGSVGGENQSKVGQSWKDISHLETEANVTCKN